MLNDLDNLKKNEQDRVKKIKNNEQELVKVAEELAKPPPNLPDQAAIQAEMVRELRL